MPETPAERRKRARRWLDSLRKRFPLPRTLYLVPGISNEDSVIWDTMREWGRKTIPNWDEYCVPVQFLDFTPRDDFIDFGAELRRRIAGKYPLDPTRPVGEFDLVCYSMGGLDAFAAMIPLQGRYPFSVVPPMAKAFNYVTLDVPFRGVPNWQLRREFPDMRGRPDRQSQCTALAPDGSALRSVIAARGELHAKAERMVCISAGGDSAVQVPISSSDILSDRPPAVPWGSTPTYSRGVIPGLSHSGASAIHSDAYAIARVFKQLLFNR